jgi:hypothetical protein
MKTLIRIFPALLPAGVLSGTAQPVSGAEDPFAPDQGNKVRGRNEGPTFISVCFETFSLEMAEASTLYQDQPNDPALYKELTARVARGKAKQEGFAVLRARSGNKAALKSTSEFIYPVSYLPVTKPDEKQASATRDASPPPFPTGFKTQDVGFTLEVEPTIGMDDTIIDLRLIPSFVSLADRSKWGSTELTTETPVFDRQEVVTANTLLSGQPQLLSTLSRPPVSKLDADSAKRVWFAFVTAKIVPVTPEK